MVSWQDGRFEQIEGSADDLMPLLIWQRMIPIRKPGREPYDCTWATAVFEGAFTAQPEPASETPALVWIHVDEFLGLARQPRPLTDLVARGAQYQTAAGITLPADVVVGLSGSALYLAQFYQRLERCPRG